MKTTDKIIKVGIQAIVFDDSGKKIFLHKRKGVFGDGTWALPGGHLEFGESFEEAITREVREEHGVELIFPKVSGVFNVITDSGSHHVQIACKAKGYTGSLKILEPEKCSEIGFFPITDLPKPIFVSSKPILESLKISKLSAVRN